MYNGVQFTFHYVFYKMKNGVHFMLNWIMKMARLILLDTQVPENRLQLLSPHQTRIRDSMERINVPTW